MSRLATRTSRIRDIEELLLAVPDGLRATEIADRLNVDRRTIYRDLDFLSEQGVPLWQHAGRFGINRAHYMPAVRLTFHEALALVLAGLLLSRTIDERNPHVAAALRKLAVIMPEWQSEMAHNGRSPIRAPLHAQLERAAGRIQARSHDQRQVSVLEALAEGWGSGRKVRVNYRSPRSGSVRERILSPYALEPTASGIYVIGYDEWAGDIRTFKLDRLEDARVLDQPFAIPADFDLEAFLATGWNIMAGSEVTEVVLRFAAAVTPHLHERHWHPSQKLEATADGGCLLRVYVAEPLEMQPWIRSWGAQVEVLAPAWLREQIAAELRQAADRYSVISNQ